MHAISSFISSKKKPKHKPRPFRHFDAPLAAHLYGSTDVIDIRDQTNEVREEVATVEPSLLGSVPPSGPPRPNSASPRLDLNISAEPTGWLSLNIFEQNPTDVDSEGDLVRGSDVKNQTAQETSETSDDDIEDDGEEFTSENEQIIAGLNAIDSGFWPADGGKHQDRSMPTTKKSPPTPIKIPNYNGAQAQAQILRSGDTSSFRCLHPQSQLSTPGSSAISGTTLARALIANPYTLSPDNNSSRFRTGLVGLTRSDSATLPRDEHAFMTPSSVNFEALSPLRAPMPPIPANAESRYVPPKTPRHSGPNIRKRLKRHSSTGSLSPNFVEDLADLEPLDTRRSHSQSASVGSGDELVSRATHRISRISEASSVPPTPTYARATTRTSLDNSVESSSSLSLTSYSQVPLAASVLGALSPLGLPTSPRSPSSLGHSSEHDAPTSGKDLDALLGHYSFTESTIPNVTVFSPISEESASQLSPSPSPPVQKVEQRLRRPDDASRSGPSNASFVGRADKILSKKSEVRVYTRHPASPAGRRPLSVQAPQRSSTSSQHGQSLSTPSSRASSEWGELVPPVNSIFNRQRSGSAPNSIKVVRDSHDSTAYQITVTPLLEEENSSPASSHSNDLQQGFPETPLISPPWSSTSISSAGMTRENSMEYASLAMPTSPQSAMFASGIDQQGMAQHILVSRAASFGCNPWPSGRASEPHDKACASEPYSRVPSPSSSRKGDSPNEDNGRSSILGRSVDSEYGDSSCSSTTSGLSPATEEGFQNIVNLLPTHDTSSFASNSSTLSVPLHEASTIITHPGAGTEPTDVDSDTTILVNAPPSPRLASLSPASLLTDTSQSSSALLGPRPPELPIDNPSTPPPPASVAHSENTGSSGVLEFPPSYDNIFGVGRNERSELDSNTLYASPGLDVTPPTTPTNIPSPIHNPSPAATLTSNTKIRSRPPLPAGPRRPSRPGRVIPSLSGCSAREFNVAPSSGSTFVSRGTIHSCSDGPASPLFHTPPIQWRGYSMDVAYWTFTSAQLQSIVSRAIRESAEASSIRLLQQHVLDIEIPEERRRLEKKKMDCKSQYKQNFRKRNDLFNSLSTLPSSTGGDITSVVIKQVEELKKVSAALDTLTQDLHSADVQLAELDSLRHVHSYSALAVALRKLNKSFLKQYAETQALHKQVDILEEENDEAWKKAEVIANKFDIMSGNLETLPFEHANQTARVSASRKSSNRISKAGLRNCSQRSSLASNRSSSVNPSTRVSSLSSNIPPVPPVPRQKPSDIRTDLFPRSTALYTDLSTPNTETRDMIQAEEELYQMLGLANTRLHRSSSVNSLTDPARCNHFRGSRPVSAPPSSTLMEAHHASIVDREAMVATFEILSNQ